MFKTILLHKLCDLDHKVVLLRWSDRGTSLWERYMSGSIDETTFMCAAERNNRQSAVWLSVLEERSEQWKTIFCVLQNGALIWFATKPVWSIKLHILVSSSQSFIWNRRELIWCGSGVERLTKHLYGVHDIEGTYFWCVKNQPFSLFVC